MPSQISIEYINHTEGNHALLYWKTGHWDHEKSLTVGQPKNYDLVCVRRINFFVLFRQHTLCVGVQQEGRGTEAQLCQPTQVPLHLWYITFGKFHKQKIKKTSIFPLLLTVRTVSKLYFYSATNDLLYKCDVCIFMRNLRTKKWMLRLPYI
jgi:hypothetical protein